MKKIKLLLAAMAAMVGMSANAQVTIDTDLTSKFSSLATSQWQGSSGQVGWAAPKVKTNNGLTVAAWERYNGSCDWTGDIMYTTVTGLDKGTYRIELYGAAAFTFGRGFGSTAFTGDFSVDANGAYSEGYAITENTGVTLYATTSEGTVAHEIPIYYATNFNGTGIATAVLEGVEVGTNGQIQIGLSKTSTSTNWHVVQLKGVTATVDADAALAAKVEEVESFDQTALTDEDAQALQAVINTYKGQTYTTADEYLAAIAALDQAVKDAQAAIERAEALSIAKPKLDAMKAFVDATNFYTTEAYNEYYGQWAAKYEAGTLTLDEANALQDPSVIAGWHVSPSVDKFLLSVWDAEPDYTTYYINTWSTEGENDGSNFKVPFFEYWTGDDNSLGAKVLTATLSGLDANAVYSVKIWARVRQTNNQTKTDGSITLQVGDGKTADLTAGAQIGTSQFYIGTFTAYGKADSNGVLTVKINVAEGSNISWLSFKNAMYSEVDLTALETELAETVAAAEAVEGKMNADVESALAQAIADYKNASYDDPDDYQDAINAVVAATNAANASIAKYAATNQAIESYSAEAENLDEAGQAAFNSGIAAILTGYNEGTLTDDETSAIAEIYIAAIKAQNAGADMTAVAPTSWNSWVGATGTVAADFMKEAAYVGIAERYQNGAFTGDVMTQTIDGLQPGTYTVVLHGGASYTSGRGFDGATGKDHAFFFANDALQSLEVYDRTVIADGTVETATLVANVKEDGVLKYGIQNITIGANWFVIDLESITYTSAQQATTDVTLAVTDAKWATFIAPFDVTIPEGVTVYTVDDYEKSGEHKGLLTMTEVTNTIAANTPVLLNAESPVNTTVSGVSTAEGMNYTTGLLTGVYGNLEITNGYVLQNQTENGIGFYAVSTDNKITIPANHAYLSVTDGEVKAFFFGDTATAIQGVMNALQAGETFDLNGRRVSKLQKGGIYIVNGVKVAVK